MIYFVSPKKTQTVGAEGRFFDRRGAPRVKTRARASDLTQSRVVLLLGRRRRIISAAATNNGVLVVGDRLLELGLKLLGRRLEALDRLAQPHAQLGQLARAEDERHDAGDHDDLGQAEAKEAGARDLPGRLLLACRQAAECWAQRCGPAAAADGARAGRATGREL